MNFYTNSMGTKSQRQSTNWIKCRATMKHVSHFKVASTAFTSHQHLKVKPIWCQKALLIFRLVSSHFVSSKLSTRCLIYNYHKSFFFSSLHPIAFCLVAPNIIIHKLHCLIIITRDYLVFHFIHYGFIIVLFGIFFWYYPSFTVVTDDNYSNILDHDNYCGVSINYYVSNIKSKIHVPR